MSDDRDARIRAVAYRIWLEEGCPDGRAEAHWEMARDLVAFEDGHGAATRPNPLAGNRERTGGGEPVEPREAVENQGEFPRPQTGQGDRSAAPKRRRRPARAK
jgi:hypothetical protein